MQPPRDGWPDVDRFRNWLTDEGWEPCGMEFDPSSPAERWRRGEKMIVARGETELARAVDAWAQAERRRSDAIE